MAGRPVRNGRSRVPATAWPPPGSVRADLDLDVDGLGMVDKIVPLGYTKTAGICQKEHSGGRPWEMARTREDWCLGSSGERIG